MNNHEDNNNYELKEGDKISGYALKRIVELKEIDSVFYDLEHMKTGAKHVHIANNDKENTFSVAFLTTPSDSTGVAHILEHTALCGSKKYPVKDPFFSMIKRSLNTFMNAFTASDWTMYPFSTQNRKDFYNLMEVYLDAAFFPRLTELSFMQEGHRMEIIGDIKNIDLKNRDSFDLEYKGIVYNEMKGAMSSSSQVMIRSLLNALYPSTTYSYNSGGDPAVIPDLTYKQLLEFHKRYYHPSNAFFYTYGDIPLKSNLDFINDKVLNNFIGIDPDTAVPSQPRWKEPREVSYPYPIAKDEDPSKKYQFCLAWLLGDIKDSYEILLCTILEQILLGNSASPLRKALIDSELGSALCDGAGFDSDNRDTMFTCGLKDIKKSSVEEIETIIFNTLNDLADKGIDKKFIESAIHQIEFHRKEVTNIPYPYGIKLLLSFSGSWFHGGKPEEVLLFDTVLERLKKDLSTDFFLENKIREYFINNTHMVNLTLVPDQTMEDTKNREINNQLKRAKKELSDKDIKKIYNDTIALKNLQEDDENISCLPTLELEEIPPNVLSVKTTDPYDQCPAVCYKQPTSGINYFVSAAGAADIPGSLLPYVPFFSTAFSKMGSKKHDYAEMAQLIDTYTGGIGLSSSARTRYDEQGECVPIISFTGKCLKRNQDKMFDIIKELICEYDFSDLSRLKKLLFEYRAGMENTIIQNGHVFALSLASRNFSTTCAMDEKWHGISQVRMIKSLVDQLQNNNGDGILKDFSDNLTKIPQHLFFSSNYKMALISEEESLPSLIENSRKIHDCLEKKEINGFGSPDLIPGNDLPIEGWSTSSSVSFVASCFKTVRMEHEDAPALSLISKILRSMYLHREIREKGGAYGGFSMYKPENGLFCFASYRDPHIINTLKVFDNATSFITSGKFSNLDVKEAILQICSEIDKPDTPGTSAVKAFFRSVVSLTDEVRNSFKERLLRINRDNIIEVAEKYFGSDTSERSIAVISSEEKLKKAKSELKDREMKLYKI
jgi:presequence protease